MKCSVCVNSNKETVIKIAKHYYMCESCVRENFETKRCKILRLERLLEYVIECGL